MKMDFWEFRDAAKKHFKTCECLYEKCNYCLNDWIIKEEIYYLLGYVIEMGLKYIVLKQVGEDEIESLNFNNKREIENFFNERNINIRFFTHKLNGFIDYINEINVNFEALENIRKFFIENEWDISMRYHCKEERYRHCRDNLDEIYKEVKNFLEYCYKI
jgi:hypothetical protein